MKKFVKICSLILLVIVVLTSAVAFWQWKNIKGIVIGVSENQEEIKKRREDNQTKLVEDVNTLLDEPIREMTEEEKIKIEEGTLTASEVYQQLFEEKNSEIEEKKVIPAKTDEDKTSEAPKENTEKADNSHKKDEIVSRYMAELYRLQNEFTARAEATIAAGANYYESINAHPQDAAARAATIKKYTPIVRGIESDCDARVEAIIANLRSELEKIGADTSIIGTIRQTYANEKQLKLSYYANKYLK